ncbi:glycosyltransferase [uncultured Desulfovibrio sp.]|uniref:glycosyltransferase n=1 Tax=uncultured Desulfovibrio sp. TaxID=167968 RepID=UPI0026023368|nr:glycosyltransferase [uncultured Desulfovibrio sp.]
MGSQTISSPNNARHILHIVESFGGGTLKALTVLTKTLDNFQHSIIYSRCKETPRDFRHLFREDIQLVPLDIRRSRNPFRLLRSILALKGEMERLRPDVVHCHSSVAGILGRVAARLAGFPCVYTPHAYGFLRTDMSPWQRRLLRQLERLLARCGTATIACGKEEFLLARGLSSPGHPVFLVRNALDLSDHSQPPSRPPSFPRVGICGRLTPQHGIAWTVETATLLQNEASWIWIGADKASDVLPPFMEKSGWLSPQEALRELASVTAVLHPTLWDGLAYTLLEAMSLEKPIVASDIPANRAIIRHGENGFLASSPEETARLLRILLHDPDLCRRMGRNAAEYVRKVHDPALLRRRYTRIYTALAEKTVPMRPRG